MKFLHEHISFDLPPPLLKNETRRALNELVHRNRERGVPDEMLKEKEKELIEGAGSLAAHRLKTNFILHRIAEREKIKMTREEIDRAHPRTGGALQRARRKNAQRAGGTRPDGWPCGGGSAGQDP